MASSPQSFCYIMKFVNILCIILSVIVFIGSSAAARPISSSVNFNQHWTKQELAGDRHQNMIFTMLPKGVILPPSGPSNRHNSVVSNSPPNWKLWNTCPVHAYIVLNFCFPFFLSPLFFTGILYLFEGYFHYIVCNIFPKWKTEVWLNMIFGY